jgi:hypothetical protein
MLPRDIVAAGSIPDRFLHLSINWKELYAILAGIWSVANTYGFRVVFGRRLYPILDNQSDCGVLRKRGSTSVAINELMEMLFWTEVAFNMEIGGPNWISTAGNVFMDAYSRVPVYIDASLRDDIFELLSLRWGPFDIDLMATDATAKCQRFFSQYACLRSEAVDVLSQDLGGLRAYGFPPVGFIMPLLAHMRACRARAVLVIPSSCHVWTPLVVSACVDSLALTGSLLPFAFEATRNGRVPSRAYNLDPFYAVLLDFASDR